MMQSLRQDIRYGYRTLVTKPGFTATALLTLAVGIGANTAIFSFVNGILLRPLPYEASERLVWIWDSNPQIGYPRFSSSVPNFLDWREQCQSFEHMAAFVSWSFNLTGSGEPERISGALASASLFPMLGVQTAHGRTFLPAEDKPGGKAVVLLSHGLWKRRFGQDPGIVGGSLTLNGKIYTIVGVLSHDFRISDPSEVWVPIGSSLTEARRGNHFVSVIARLKQGVALRDAQAEMDVITRRLHRQYPDSNTGWGVALEPLHERISGGVRRGLWVLLGAVGLVLLIACVNVANLMLARASSRQKELAIRTALGATRQRIIRQLLAESFLLSLVGGGLGLLLGIWGIDLLLALSPGNIPRAEEITVDWSVLAFTLSLSVITGILFGLAPALKSSKLDANVSLKEATRAFTAGLQHNRARGLMVVAEVALSLVLLAGAGLMIRSFIRLLDVRLGFNSQNLITMHVSLPQVKYSSESQKVAFFKNLLHEIRTLPGIESVGIVDPLPLTGNAVWEFFIEAREPPAPNVGINANFRRASPEYFGTMSIPLLKGRLFTEADSSSSEQVLLINETTARQLWSNEDPIGKRISFRSPEGPWRTIVGIVGDVRHDGLDQEAGLEIYRPFDQQSANYMALVIRTRLPSGAIAAAVRAEVLKLDQDQPVFGIRTMEEITVDSRAPRRFNMILLTAFALLALLLSSIGIYGVISYSVSQLTHEIGIRMSLGAQPQDVLRLVIGRGARLLLIGIGTGLTAALAFTQLMSTLLFGVSPTDPATFTSVSLLLGAVGVLACYIPAHKAARVDPVVALRYE